MTYDDGLLRVDDDGILVRRYYFPLATARRVGWSDLRGHEVRPLTSWGGRHRLWGTHRLDWWFPLDTHRSSKSHLVLLRTHGVSPAVTPDDVDAFTAEIDRHRAR